MMPTCKDVSEQLSENMDQPLTGLRRWKLKFHLLVCRYCRRYQKQVYLSSKTINLLAKKQPIEPNEQVEQQVLEHYRNCHHQKKD